MLVTPKTMLRIQNRYLMPGQETDIPDELARKLLSAGLVECAVEPPMERAVSIDGYRVGNSPWYEINGKKIRGKEEAIRRLKEMEG